MRIDELTITNFKCFENETFRFNPHFNVVIGKNGSGKSSLLDAAAGFAGFYLYGIDEKSYEFIAESEVRTILKDGQPRKQIPVVLYAKGAIHNNKIPITWEESMYNTTDYSASIQEQFEKWKPALPDYARGDLMESRKADGNVVFPLIVYYGTGRLWNQKKEIKFFKQEEGVFLGYKDCLSGQASSDIFLSWFKTYEDEVVKFRQPLDELFLKIIKEAISSMVPEWTDMAYSRKEEDLIGTFKDESGTPNILPFSNLSDGYRNIIGMVADMVYRCIQLNPGLKENVLTETDGIVLIDEIDLHLHPEWQRRVVGDLKRIFPKVQFIVTTHSPFIIQSLKQEELIVLDKNFVEDKDPWRKSVEEIAEDEMQVPDVKRSERFNEMMEIAREYFTLVKQNDDKDTLRKKINEAKSRLDNLRLLFADDPAYVIMLEAQMDKIELDAARIEK